MLLLLLASLQGAGRAKKARRGHGCSDGGEADRSDSDCSDDDRRCPSADRNTLYSLRNGPAVRLEEAATAPTAGPTAIAAPGAWCWQQQQREEGMPHACLEPLDLPNLRPCSAEGTRLNTVSGICRRSTSGSGVSLLSPPLYTVLQSPLVQAAPGTGVRCSCIMGVLLARRAVATCSHAAMQFTCVPIWFWAPTRPPCRTWWQLRGQHFEPWQCAGRASQPLDETAIPGKLGRHAWQPGRAAVASGRTSGKHQQPALPQQQRQPPAGSVVCIEGSSCRRRWGCSFCGHSPQCCSWAVARHVSVYHGASEQFDSIWYISACSADAARA